MRISFRQIAGLALVLAIGLSSVTMALARGQMRTATGSIVLCTGTGPVLVAVDADGDPVGRAHICPDCAFGALAWVPVAAGGPVFERIGYRAVFDPVGSPGAGRMPATARARDPPRG